MAKVAVILPTFNRPKLVQKAIESVQAQTFRDWKLYIMDNSSPNLWPRMQQIFLRYTKNDSRIKLDHTHVVNEDRYKKAWCGVVANKAVLKLSEGEPYIVLSVDDEIMMPNKLAVLTEFLDKHPEASIVAGVVEELWNDGSVRRKWGGVNLRNAVAHMDWVQPMFRRTLMEKIGKISETGNDGEYFQRIAKVVKCVYGIPIALDRIWWRTRGCFHNKVWREKGLRGELME